MASIAKVVGLSRDKDKNEEVVHVSSGLMLGRTLYQEASTWPIDPQRHLRHSPWMRSWERGKTKEEVRC